MARPLRIQFEGAAYHITSQGNAGAKIFINQEDREAFLSVLDDVVSRLDWICHAYCLMDQHYHILVETPQSNLSRGMQLLNGIYTQRFDRAHDRSGHLLEGRYKAVLVEKGPHLLELARHVILNPVRAGVARSARDWPWSSYRATAGLAPAPAFLSVEWILSQLGTDEAQARTAYRKFVSKGREIDAWHCLQVGILLGSDSFVERIRPLLREAAADPGLASHYATVARPSLGDLVKETTDKKRRNCEIYQAVRTHRYTLQQVADHLGLHYSTISLICSRLDAEAPHCGRNLAAAPALERRPVHAHDTNLSARR
ncbi:transposase [Candidatus Bipolaricaulota bacterium]